MNISNIALIAFIASTTMTLTQSFMQAKPHISSSMNVVSFTSTIHREEVDLESMSVSQLQQMHSELEAKNEACTEDCTQTNPECDIVLKDERDLAMMKIQYVLQERSADDTLKNLVDMDVVSEIVRMPWTHTLDEIKNIVLSMESLNCLCTEEGNQTNAACDVQLKDERDIAIETLNLYMKSVQNLVADAAAATAAATHEEEKRKLKQLQEETRKRNLLEKQERSLYAHVEIAFDMGEIRDCVNNPGSKSIEVMQQMLTHLEAQHNSCTEDGTQTNPECDVEVKAERDSFMESLVSQIHDAKICLNEIKAFANQNNINQMAIDDVMNTVMNTIPNLSSSKSSSKNKIAAKKAAPSRPTFFTAPTDEFLIQI